MQCFVCETNEPAMYTACCIQPVCAVCIENMKEDQACTCEYKGMPIFREFKVINPELIRKDFDENVARFNKFVKKSENKIWALKVPRDEFIKAQRKEIELVREIVECIEKFPNMPEVPQYVFEEDNYIITDTYSNICVVEPELKSFVELITAHSINNLFINEETCQLSLPRITNYVTIQKQRYKKYTIADFGFRGFEQYDLQRYANITEQDIINHPEYDWRLSHYGLNTHVSIKYIVDQFEIHGGSWSISVLKSFMETLLMRDDMTDTLAERLINFSIYTLPKITHAHWASLEFVKKYYKNVIIYPARCKAVTLDVHLQYKYTLWNDVGISLNPNIMPADVKKHTEIKWDIDDLAVNPNFKWNDLIELFPDANHRNLFASYSRNTNVSWEECIKLYNDVKMVYFKTHVPSVVNLSCRTGSLREGDNSYN
jgi:hypothetical protein